MSKHTQGPWTFSREERFGEVRFYIAQADGAPYTPQFSDVSMLIAETVSGERIRIQEANAMLIAAAPELLEACEAFIAAEGVLNIVAAHSMARAAITKATGAASSAAQAAQGTNA